MTYLPDTNACIALLRQRNPKLTTRWQAVNVSEVVLCSVVVYELRHGAERRPHPARFQSTGRGSIPVLSG